MGLIHSRISYLLPLWASSQNTQMRRAQVILNKAARWTSALPRRTRTSKLMSENNWLSVQEMARYQEAIMMWKLIHRGKPGHIYNKLQIADDLKVINQEPRLQFSKNNFQTQNIKKLE